MFSQSLKYLISQKKKMVLFMGAEGVMLEHMFYY